MTHKIIYKYTPPYQKNTTIRSYKNKNEMPYIKEKIGAVPYYIPQEQTTLFRLKNCENIHNKLEKLGVHVRRENTFYGCFLTYLDIYDSTTKINNKSRFNKLF